LLALAILATGAVPALAQFDRGQVAGFVRDEQGGVVPGATIKVTHQQTRVEHTYTTDNSGYYIAPALLPGVYEVAVELSGFKKFVKTSVKVDANSKAQVDATLSAGGMQEAVTVVGEEPSAGQPPAESRGLSVQAITELM
jgi:hypothetical protein